MNLFKVLVERNKRMDSFLIKANSLEEARRFAILLYGVKNEEIKDIQKMILLEENK